MPNLRTEQGLLEEIRNLPYLLQDVGLERRNPRCGQVKLVKWRSGYHKSSVTQKINYDSLRFLEMTGRDYETVSVGADFFT